MAVFRGVSILKNDDFLDGFVVVGLEALALNSGVVIVLAFDEEVVGAGTSTTDVKADSVAETALRGGSDAGKRKRQFIRIQGCDRQAVDFHLADGAVNL